MKIETESNEILLEVMEDWQEIFDEEFDISYIDVSLCSIQSSLIEKLNLGGGNFKITPLSLYTDPTWLFPRLASRQPVSIPFVDQVEGFANFKKSIVYFALPENCPFGTVNAYSTTKDIAGCIDLIAKYLFIPNHLTATAGHVQLITAKMIEEALELSKSSEFQTNHHNLFRALTLYLSLSDKGLIPEEYRPKAGFKEFDFARLRREAHSRFMGSLRPWQPFTENDLEQMVSYAVFWTELAIPKLQKLSEEIERFKLNKKNNKYRLYLQSPSEEIEALNCAENGKEIFSISRTHSRVTSNNGKKIDRFSYTWRESFTVALDNIRNSTFILVALLIGARKDELNHIRFSDIIQEHNGDYWVWITRWKTSDDPNYQGTPDKIPLPYFVGEVIRKYQALATFKNRELDDHDWLFRNNYSNIASEKAYKNVDFVIASLKSIFDIDNLHCHRFRKTIAEILINRDERNIEIIRALFGHKSYAMTLKYIGRNPLMVRGIAIAMEQMYSENLYQIFKSAITGPHSGEITDEISRQVKDNPKLFEGTTLKATVLSFVVHMLEAGQPIFISRTPIGTYCFSLGKLDESNAPPCTKNVAGKMVRNTPDPKNCDIQCRKVVALENAKQALLDCITFCKYVLEKSIDPLDTQRRLLVERQLVSYEMHWRNLNFPRSELINSIEI